MSPLLFSLVFGVLPVCCAIFALLKPLISGPLRQVPGPKLFAATKWRLALEDWKGTRTRAIHRLHQQYGPAVRIGPNEVSFNSLSGLKTIYGPGSQFGRTAFYRMFDVYGKPNLFTFHSPTLHGQRKKLVSNAYSKSTMLKEPATTLVEGKVRKYMNLIEKENGGVSDIFKTMHYYSLDNITAFIYGNYGSTSAMDGNRVHRDLLNDIIDPARRKLSWSIIHIPALTKWLYTRTNFMEALVTPFLPMQKPTTYTGIRKFALDAYMSFANQMKNGKTLEYDQKTGGEIPHTPTTTFHCTNRDSRPSRWHLDHGTPVATTRIPTCQRPRRSRNRLRMRRPLSRWHRHHQ